MVSCPLLKIILCTSILRKTFGPKTVEHGSWRKLQNDELYSLQSLFNLVRVIKLRRIRWAGQVALMGEGKSVYRLLDRMPEGKKQQLGRPRRRWQDNIKMDLRDTGIDRAN
jgi:hypothetical protein